MKESQQHNKLPQGKIYCPEKNEGAQSEQLRFWEIDQMFKCPVVGMCLTLVEQKQLLRRSGIRIKNKSAFELHESLVACSESDNRLSRKVDLFLNRKFGKEVKKLLELDHKEFEDHFNRMFEAGHCTSLCWAVAINPDLPKKTKRALFGSIHMAMHWSGEQSLKLKQRMTRQREALFNFHEQYKNERQQRRLLQKENNRLKKDQAELNRTVSALNSEKKSPEKTLVRVKVQKALVELERENRALHVELNEQISDCAAKQRQIDLLKVQNNKLSSKLDRQKESNSRCLRDAHDAIQNFIALNNCDSSCPSFDLCQKRILIVGGITRMASLYRELIETSGGIFDHHDGYMKKGAKGLECRLKRADLVVCPVSCNSHAACSIVKNLAKKHNKTVHMLPNSSLNAVSQVILGINDKGTIN